MTVVPSITDRNRVTSSSFRTESQTEQPVALNDWWEEGWTKQPVVALNDWWEEGWTKQPVALNDWWEEGWADDKKSQQFA